MKNAIRKFFRRLARRFFDNCINIYRMNYEISLSMLTEYRSNFDLKYEIKKQIAYSFAQKMLEENIIEFQEEENYQTGGKTIRAKIRVI